MNEIDGIQRVIDKLKPHWVEINDDFDRKNQKFIELMSVNHDSIGQILKCHLVIENAMDEYLIQKFAIEDIHNRTYARYGCS